VSARESLEFMGDTDLDGTRRNVPDPLRWEFKSPLPHRSGGTVQEPLFVATP